MRCLALISFPAGIQKYFIVGQSGDFPNPNLMAYDTSLDLSSAIDGPCPSSSMNREELDWASLATVLHNQVCITIPQVLVQVRRGGSKPGKRTLRLCDWGCYGLEQRLGF